MRTFASHKNVHNWVNRQRHLFVLQKKELAHICDAFFGYFGLFISIDEHNNLANCCRLQHCIHLANNQEHPIQTQSNVLYADPQLLPFADDSIDLVVIHHFIELSYQPDNILHQAARITMPEGKLIIFGSNPISLAGLWYRFAKKWKKNWRITMPRAGQVIHSLHTLGFYDIRIHWQYPLIDTCICYCATNKKLQAIKKIATLCARLPLPLSGSWCIHATKHTFAQLVPVEQSSKILFSNALSNTNLQRKDIL